MELKNVALAKVGLLLFLIGCTATTTVDASFDPSSFITKLLLTEGDLDHSVKSTATACCDKCFCDYRSMPPQCQCEDVGTKCHSDCEVCRCDWSRPPQCQCMDNTASCYQQCNSFKAQTRQEY